jgi:hypothetical protein
MKLPALKNATALSSLNGQSVEEFIRNSTQNLQQAAAAMPGSGIAGAVYLKFDGNTGIYRLNKEVVDPKSLGRVLVPQHGMFEGIIEWAGGSPLQKIQRQLLGVHHDEPMTEQMLEKQLSPGAYKKENDGPKHMLGFVGFMLDDGATVVFEGSSNGAIKALNGLATTATQALAAFGEIVHPVIELGSGTRDIGYRIVHEPKFPVVGYVTDQRTREVDTIADDDIVTRPTVSRAKLRRETKEAPAL